MDKRKNNKGTPGNAGGKEWGKENREKAATLKGLCLDWMIDVMNGKDEKKKELVVSRIATTCLPQEIGGDGENPILIKVLRANGNINDQATPVAG